MDDFKRFKSNLLKIILFIVKNINLNQAKNKSKLTFKMIQLILHKKSILFNKCLAYKL